MKKLASVLGAAFCASTVFAGSAQSTSGQGARPLRVTLDPATFATIADGVVLIRTFDCNGRAKYSGSGFLVGEQVVMMRVTWLMNQATAPASAASKCAPTASGFGSPEPRGGRAALRATAEWRTSRP